MLGAWAALAASHVGRSVDTFNAVAVAGLSAECAHDPDDSETPMSGLRALSL